MERVDCGSRDQGQPDAGERCMEGVLDCARRMNCWREDWHVLKRGV